MFRLVRCTIVIRNSIVSVIVLTAWLSATSWQFSRVHEDPRRPGLVASITLLGGTMMHEAYKPFRPTLTPLLPFFERPPSNRTSGKCPACQERYSTSTCRVEMRGGECHVRGILVTCQIASDHSTAAARAVSPRACSTQDIDGRSHGARAVDVGERVHMVYRVWGQAPGWTRAAACMIIRCNSEFYLRVKPS